MSGVPGRTITSTTPAGSKPVSLWALHLIGPMFLYMYSISICDHVLIYTCFIPVSVMRNHSGQPIMDKQPTGMANSSFRMKSVQQSRTQRGSSSRPIADRDPATAEYAPGRSTSAWHSHKWMYCQELLNARTTPLMYLLETHEPCMYVYICVC